MHVDPSIQDACVNLLLAESGIWEKTGRGKKTVGKRKQRQTTTDERRRQTTVDSS